MRMAKPSHRKSHGDVTMSPRKESIINSIFRIFKGFFGMVHPISQKSYDYFQQITRYVHIYSTADSDRGDTDTWMYSMYYYYVCTEPYLFIQSIYVHSIKNRNKAVEEPWIMCSLSCIATAHVLGTATGGNIAMYGIYMMAPSTADSCRRSCLLYLDARVGSSSLVRVASSHINIKTADK